jgi:NADH:ubiquinone oxidoreductase subunit C
MNSDRDQYDNTNNTSGTTGGLVSGEEPNTPSSSLKSAPPVSSMPTASSPSKLSTGAPELVPTFEKGIAAEITTKFGQLVHVIFIKPLRTKIAVEPSNIIKVATFLRDDLGFDHAESVAGTDYPKDNQIEVIYHLGSYSKIELAGHVLSLTTRTNRDDARLPSLISVYKSVEYHERETFEMLGVYFEGHPRNERFLLPEDWADIPPLRKEFRIKGR